MIADGVEHGLVGRLRSRQRTGHLVGVDRPAQCPPDSTTFQRQSDADLVGVDPGAPAGQDRTLVHHDRSRALTPHETDELVALDRTSAADAGAGIHIHRLSQRPDSRSDRQFS